MTKSSSEDPARRFIHGLSTPLTTIFLLVEGLIEEAKRGTLDSDILVKDLEKIGAELKVIDALIAGRRKQIG
ncbi:MAG TPA: hypothetical protein VM598_10125 [Bdellovibrionota bacterium]|nr:hypothetical protein [Bdellovibrionota bacterium]